VKKFLAVVAVLAPVVALLPAAPASADSVCTPVTLDGKPVLCEDLTPVEQAVADAEATVAQTEQAIAAAEATVLQIAAAVVGEVIDTAEPLAQQAITTATTCERVVTSDGKVSVYVAATSDDTGSAVACSGYRVTLAAGQDAGTTPVHVPQACVTITNTCAGPVDTTLPLPTVVITTVCVQPADWTETKATGVWTDSTGPGLPSLGCTTLEHPVG